MSNALECLSRVGLPYGAIRPIPQGPWNAEEIAIGIHQLADSLDQLAPAVRESFLAWLRAFQHHWPDQFVQLLGQYGADLIARLTTLDFDPNRYLKLRRIAIENLAQLI
jgi:hypothetical protein